MPKKKKKDSVARLPFNYLTLLFAFGLSVCSSGFPKIPLTAKIFFLIIHPFLGCMIHLTAYQKNLVRFAACGTDSISPNERKTLVVSSSSSSSVSSSSPGYGRRIYRLLFLLFSGGFWIKVAFVLPYRYGVPRNPPIWWTNRISISTYSFFHWRMEAFQAGAGRGYFILLLFHV